MHVLAAVMGGAAAAICCVAMAACLYVHKRNKKKRNGELGTGEWLPEYRSPATGGGGRSFSLAEIKAATENFREALVVGMGRQGKMFRSVVDGGTAVAIKRANPSPGRSAREFRAEIETLSNLRPRHLLPLLGFLLLGQGGDGLVYRYMPRGTLREHLHGKSGNPAMTWWRRLDAYMGNAWGLHCLHAGGVVHGDVRTTTILIDENWVAKLSDFGLSNSKHATMKVSFGVVLFEAHMARRPAMLPGDQAVGLAEHALACHRDGTLPDVFDTAIKGQVAPECLEKFTGTAVECLAQQGTERPAMGDVVWNLELSMQLQLINHKRT